MKKKIVYELSNKLFNKLDEIRNELSYKEENDVTLNDMIEEALMSYFNIKISDINDDIEIIDAVIVDAINDANNLNDYYVYIYYNDSKKTHIEIGGYHFFSEPIYVGKGHGNRIYDLNNRESNLIEKINDLKSTDEFTIHKLITDLDEVTAYHYEQLFISKFGKLNDGTGSLYNIKNGYINKMKKMITTINDLNLEQNLIKLILESLNETENVSKTAKELNINIRTLYRKIKKYSIIKHDNMWMIKKDNF